MRRHVVGIAVRADDDLLALNLIHVRDERSATRSAPERNNTCLLSDDHDPTPFRYWLASVD